MAENEITKVPGTIDIPLSELSVMDVGDKKVEELARSFIMGNEAVGDRDKIRQMLESKVTKKIGKKGKYLTDKLFELIEGVYVVDKRGGKDGHSIRYYQEKPNLNAITYALDRVLGKPKQVQEISEEKKGVILVEHVIRNLANNPYRNNDKRSEQRESGVGGNNLRPGAGGTSDAAGLEQGDTARVGASFVQG